jgi:hypothetical protein
MIAPVSLRTSWTLVLLGGLLMVAAGGAAAHAAGSGSAAPLTAKLLVSDRSPLQLRGVLFDASGSTGPISYYAFNYGDGVSEVSESPLAMHGYRNAGTYHATVFVIDAAGGVARSAVVTIRVRDGIPPVVMIDSPRAGQVVALGRGAAVRLRGTATDPNGVRRVQLAIQLTSSARRFRLPSGYCVWYNGKDYLDATACASPYYFTARFARGRWTFTIPAAAQIPAGAYVVRASATDHAGNVSSVYAISLRTIVPFRLVRP